MTRAVSASPHFRHVTSKSLLSMNPIVCFGLLLPNVLDEPHGCLAQSLRKQDL